MLNVFFSDKVKLSRCSDDHLYLYILQHQHEIFGDKVYQCLISSRFFINLKASIYSDIIIMNNCTVSQIFIGFDLALYACILLRKILCNIYSKMLHKSDDKTLC